MRTQTDFVTCGLAEVKVGIRSIPIVVSALCPKSAKDLGMPATQINKGLVNTHFSSHHVTN